MKAFTCACEQNEEKTAHYEGPGQEWDRLLQDLPTLSLTGEQ